MGICMKLRDLQAKDISFMFEWMHDDFVVHYLKQDFTKKKIEDCIKFIELAQDKSENIHLAIVDDFDEYMGTVSLKNLNQNTAEFAIVLRSCAMGGGFANFAMNEIFEYGYKNYGIEIVYWCVNIENRRALNFYDKYKYHRSEIPIQAIGYTEEEEQNYIWYCTKIIC